MVKDEKLSFSFFSKPSKSNTNNRPLPFFDPNTTAETVTQFITEFDSSQPAASASSLFVIPPIPDNFHSKLKSSLPNPSFDQHQRFVVEKLDSVSKENIPFGLTVRSKTNKEEKRNLSQEEETALKRFRDDMKFLPDHRGIDEYKEASVENFGEAVLVGYGWKKGMGIGKNAKEDTKVVQYDRRAGRRGLGFDPKIHKRRRERRGNSVLVDNVMKARVYGDITCDLGSEVEVICVGKLKELDIGDDIEERSKTNHSTKKKSHIQWLRGHIKVKVVSEEIEKGKWYMKKGEVVDVVGPTVCDIMMENGEIIQGVDQEMLETALPEIGGSVVVLYGKHDGVYGRLFEKDVAKDMGVVRDVDSHEFINVSLDQIAEYVGDPSYLGY